MMPTPMIFFALAFLILLYIGLNYLSKKTSTLNPEHYQSKWQNVVKLLENGDENHLKLAIIEADKLLDIALKELRIPGDKMSDRLTNSRSILSSKEKIWAARKLRNQVVHEHITVPKKSAAFAVKAYGKALRELGAIR